MNRIKLVAFDLDGTLSQHRSTPPPESFKLLDELKNDYRLLMVGAGACERIHLQMNKYPIDIIGNYGMQTARYIAETSYLHLVESFNVPTDEQQTLSHVSDLREKFGWEKYTGKSVEFHASGVITFPLLGTEAAIKNKLTADPTRRIRQTALEEVRKRFAGYTVFIGGSSSFDIVPMPFCKSYALKNFAENNNINFDEILYVGDDYGPGGNDEDVYKSGISFVWVDNYLEVSYLVREILHSM